MWTHNITCNSKCQCQWQHHQGCKTVCVCKKITQTLTRNRFQRSIFLCTLYSIFFKVVIALALSVFLRRMILTLKTLKTHFEPNSSSHMRVISFNAEFNFLSNDIYIIDTKERKFVRLKMSHQGCKSEAHSP